MILHLNAHATDLYVGTYTKNFGGNAQGIYLIKFNELTNTVLSNTLVATANNPAYLWIDSSKLYAVNEISSYSTPYSGSVTGYSIGHDGELTKLNQEASIGANTVHLAVDSDSKTLLVANYGNDAPNSAGVTSFPITANGIIATKSQYIPYSEPGIDKNPERQANPHTHAIYSITNSDGSKLVFAVDLGLDTVFSYSLDSNTSKLTLLAKNKIVDDKNPSIATGPRHLAISPDHKFVYVLNELSADIHVYALDTKTGVFSFVQKINSYNGSIPATHNQPAEIVISPNHKYIYVSNRGSNSIDQFKINHADGKLTFDHSVSSVGDWPRDINIDKHGKYMAIANQNSSNITIYAINQENGHLINPKTIPVSTPVSVKFN